MDLLESANAPVETLQKLLDAGASLNALDPFGNEAVLHKAAKAGNVRNVAWLLEHGAKWNFGATMPGQLALQNGHKECYDVIFEHAVKEQYERFSKPYKPVQEEEWEVTIDQKRADNKEWVETSKLGMYDKVLLDHGGVGVMMEWERPIMKKTASLLLDGLGKGKRVLNIGFGMGIIDTFFQSYEPSHHTIIEAHPQLLKYMRRTGWYNKPNVRILEGRWQEFLLPAEREKLRGTERLMRMTVTSGEAVLRGVGKFDVVYFDTFQEGYWGGLDFFRCVPGLLLNEQSRFSFFHGHGRHYEFLYRVIAEVAKRQLRDIGLDTEWYKVTVDPKTMFLSVVKRECGDEQKHPHLIPICTPIKKPGLMGEETAKVIDTSETSKTSSEPGAAITPV
ncbi:uncharacterized protein LAESUDRAFT_764222 [Laetiporus sulphureus 93-53]|uniref:Uncharacterized protein n=1 Tax=Laetiporus sulphureus 93-53 TaxID=1314785 RepID=A0A165BEV7_9APHY|nr:uncharacterized protein LAESUDRAFT_764222 [Laetiporus sulphureus 93-53]KZT00904.1 hypothetical protein LAESUDRAFT_764222 [Laetiporus sulphureus 93-53]